MLVRINLLGVRVRLELKLRLELLLRNEKSLMSFPP